MKISAKIAVLTSAALLFGASAAVAQDATEETTTTTTTTVTETSISEDGDYVGYEVEGEIAVEGEDTVIQGQTTNVVTKEYDGYLQVPVQTTEETTYTTVIGQPTGRWSASDWFGGKFSLTNTVSSDIVKARGSLGGDSIEKSLVDGTTSDIKGNAKVAADDYFYAVEMGGLYDEVELKYEAKRLRFLLKPQFGIDDATENFWSGYYAGDVKGLDNDDLALYWTDFDWYIELLPFDIVGLNLHRDIYTAGSYLPVADNNVEGGNLSSDGFTVAAYPTENLTITSTLPFDFNVAPSHNWLNAEYDDGWYGVTTTGGVKDEGYKFNIGFGAEYKLGNFMVIGGTFKDVLNSIARQQGLYFRLNIASMFFNIGYTHTQASFKSGTRFDYWELPDEFFGEEFDGIGKLAGHHVVNFAWGWDLGKLDLGVDFLYNIMKNQSLYDIYGGLKVGYALSDAFSFGVRGFVAYDLGTDLAQNVSVTDVFNGSGYVTPTFAAGLTDDAKESDADLLVGANPYVTYRTGRNEFGASMVLEVLPTNTYHTYHVKFPVYWKYTF